MRLPRVTARGGQARGPARAATGSYTPRMRLPRVTARGGAGPRAGPGCHGQLCAAYAAASRHGARLGSPEGQPGLPRAARSRVCGRHASWRVVGRPEGQPGLPRAAVRRLCGPLAPLLSARDV